MGTLFIFLVVCAAVPVMRRLHPEVERPFRVPWGPLIPVLGALSCLLLMLSLPAENWLRLLIWLVAGMLIYLFYGRRHSVLGNAGGTGGTGGAGTRRLPAPELAAGAEDRR